MSEVCRHFYVDYDAACAIKDLGVRMPANSVVYFEFDRDCNSSTNKLTFFISCFDHCPEDQRKWFLERVVELQSYTDIKYRAIVSTTRRNDLVVNLLPDDDCINLEECLDLSRSQSRDEMAQEFRAALNGLIEKRPLYESFQLQIENQLNECNDFPYLGHIILTWLGHYARGAPKAKIANAIAKLSPVTAENTVNVFISCLGPEHRQRAKNVFNWVKHAFEPWTPRSLAEAIALHECADKDVCLDDIDSSEFMSGIDRDLGGLITVQNHDIKFSHPLLYELAEIGIENTHEPAAFVHAQIATACLRYFWVENAQSKLSEFCPGNLEGGVWETALDATVIIHQRTSMAEYAVRFWPQHYKASGKFKPAELVHNLFSDKKALKYWKVPFYVLSNPFTRLQRSYISPLPTFASLGLEDLVDGQLKAERDQLCFQRNCSLAITEAARAGNIKVVQLLLDKVVMEEDELSNALFWSAASGHGDVVDMLLKKIPDLKTFCWPENLTYRAASMGLDNLLAAMQQSGRDMNEPVDDRRKATPLVVATYRNRVSTVEFMLQLDPKPDLSVRDQDGNNIMWYAAKSGDPRMVDVLVKGGATVDERCSANMKPVQLAVQWRKNKALELLIAANADFSSGEQGSDAESDRRPPLVVAADMGSIECVLVLLRNGADPNVECASGTALYKAVSGNHIDIVRMLLQNDPAAELDVSPSREDKLLIRAVCTRNPALVSLLIKHGATLDFVDPNAMFSKTPLSCAASEGDVDIVKLLLKEGSDINYTGGQASDPPLFSAIFNKKVEVAKLLLSKNGDATWAANDGWNSLHAAYNIPGLIPHLLQKNVDINSKSRQGTVLHIASRNNQPESIAVLLKQTPKPDLEVVYSDSLSHDVGCTALLLACKHRNPECVELLLKAGANQHFQKENGDDAISVLLDTKEDPERAAKCLELLVFGPYKMDVHKVDQHGNTPLHKIGTQTPASMVQILAKTDVPLTRRNNDEHGADVNVLSPRFSSILHIACANGPLNLVKLLFNAGADRDAVDPGYGESLLYTALSISDESERGKVVRYLVDVANVPLNQRGGYYAYPIIRAASMAGSITSPRTRILKFLIRRKVDLNVADDQGRCAVHLASKTFWKHGLKAPVDAGANINVKDHAGRLAIHFAASATYHDCMAYLLSKFQDKYIHEMDHDNWTPLLWAARSGSTLSVDSLVERKADLWVRGYTYGTGSDSEWSALKLARFYGRYQLQEALSPTKYTRDEPDGVKAIWDKSFHKSRLGDSKELLCSSCRVRIRGPQWKCIECTNDFSLCFKCFRYRDKIHKADHSFEEIGPFFDPNESYDGDSDLEEDGVAKERAELPEQGSGNDEETVHGDDGDDAGAATSSDETVDDIEFELETPDVIIED
ncbi:hypothetical protein ACHAPE_006558 [Trichoderma viride]